LKNIAQVEHSVSILIRCDLAHNAPFQGRTGGSSPGSSTAGA
jgi:hypothetical protein